MFKCNWSLVFCCILQIRVIVLAKRECYFGWGFLWFVQPFPYWWHLGWWYWLTVALPSWGCRQVSGCALELVQDSSLEVKLLVTWTICVGHLAHPAGVLYRSSSSLFFHHVNEESCLHPILVLLAQKSKLSFFSWFIFGIIPFSSRL